MRYIHQQSTRTSTWVIHFYILWLIVHHDSRHYAGNSMRCIILGILATAIAVVIFNKVFKNSSEEIVFLTKHFFKAEFNQFADKCLAESIALRRITNELA